MPRTIKILLGPREAENILRARAFSGRQSLDRKIRTAVEKVYPELPLVYSEREKMGEIRDRILASDEVKAVHDEYTGKLLEIRLAERTMRDERDAKLDTLFNAEVQKAGLPEGYRFTNGGQCWIIPERRTKCDRNR